MKDGQLEEKIELFIKEYLKDKQDKNIVCLVDGVNAIYFLVFSDSENEELEYSDVALLHLDTQTYEMLPPHLSNQIAEAYINHITITAEAYRYLEEKSNE